MTVKLRAKLGFATLLLSGLFFGISTFIDTSIPINIFGSDGVLRIFFVIGTIFLLIAFFLLTKPSNQVGGNRRSRKLDIFE